MQPSTLVGFLGSISLATTLLIGTGARALVINPSHVDASVPVGSPGAFEALTRDGVTDVRGTGDAFLTLNDVPPGEYRLVTYEIRGSLTDDLTTFAVENGVDTPFPDDDTTVGFVLFEDYSLFTLLRPDDQGQIFLAFGPGSPDTEVGVFNGFQLELVPEPATALLCALGLAGLARRPSRVATR